MKTVSLACVIACACAVSLAGNRATAGTPDAKKTRVPDSSPTASAETAIPPSVFTVPANPKQGRNPFFPNSLARASAPKQKDNSQPDFASRVLTGITSPPKRTAMINGRTFEPGEMGDVKLPNGSRVPIQCVEIRDDMAVVVVSGQKRELHLRSGI